MINKHKKFLLFSLVFLFGFFLFFLNSQAVEAVDCYNGPKNTDSGGCGTPCDCGDAWSKYDEHIGGSGDFCKVIGIYRYLITRISDICMTGNKCIPGEKGLRYGYCDCGYGAIYKLCCQGSTAVGCIRYHEQDPYWPPEGTCPPGSTFGTATSCGDTGPNCGQLCTQNGCDNCACDNDPRSGSYTWTSLGSSSGCTTCYCGRRIAPPPEERPTPPEERPTPSGNCSPVGQPCSKRNTCIDGCCKCGPDGRTGLDYTCGGDWCTCATTYNYPPGWQSSCGGGWVPPPSGGGCQCTLVDYGCAGSYGDFRCPWWARYMRNECNRGGCGDYSQCVLDPSCSPSACTLSFSPWPWCAAEHGICTFSGTHTVKYGADTRWAYRVATGSIPCENDYFGDPAIGTGKDCYYENTISVLTLKAGESRSITASVNVPNVSRVVFSSDNTAIAQANPFSVNAAPYTTNIYGIGGGTTSVSAVANLTPSGFCTASIPVTVEAEACTATNLKVVQPDYCLSGPAGTFSWTFTGHGPGDTQSAYRVQVDKNSNFSSPEDDSGKVTSASNSYATILGKLEYKTTYYWRVKVWDNKNAESVWISGPAFTTPEHAYPFIDFSWAPLAPGVNEDVLFSDQSTVYGGASKESWSWTFQNGSPVSSSQQNPTVKFFSIGEKLITLRVTDSDGCSCPRSKTLNAEFPLPKWKEIAPF